jgi:hypothetical protein
MYGEFLKVFSEELAILNFSKVKIKRENKNTIEKFT